MHSTEPDRADFARLLAWIQKRTGMSDQRIADAAGVNRSQVWRWTHAGSAPGYEPVRRLAAHLIAERPDLADDAAALLPAAGYETPPVTPPAGPAPDPPAPRLPHLSSPELDRYLPGVRDQLAEAMRKYGPAFTGDEAFPDDDLEAAAWDTPLLTPDEAMRQIAWLRLLRDQRRESRRETGLWRA